MLYIHIVYYTGERSLVEKIRKDAAAGIAVDRTFFLDAVDNDGDALRFHLGNGSYFDAVFVRRGYAQRTYESILEAIREKRTLMELDIREWQASHADI